MTIPSAQTVYTQASGSTSTKPFLKYFSTRAPTPNDINNWQVGQSWIVPGTSLTASITGATQADPCVITAINGFSVGQLVTITSVGGMTELNGNQYQITDADGISFTINTDSTSFTAYTTGGIATVAVEYEYILAGLTSSNGRVSANWVLLGGGSSGGSGAGGIDTLTGDSGGAVPGDATGNVNILGTAGQITVTGSPSTNTLTIALSGGGTAIDSFQPDSGTNPVVPTGTGLVTMAGSGSITTVGGTNTLTTQLTGLTNNTVLLGQGTTTIGTASGTDAQLLIGGTPPAFGQTVNNTDITPIVFNGAVSVNRANITTYNGATANIPWMLYGEVEVSSLTPATYYLASSSATGGVFYFWWSPSGAANRNQSVTVQWDSIQFDDVTQVSVLNNNAYLGEEVFTNIRDVKDSAGLQLHYLAVDVGNLNGFTGFISVLWVGNPAEGDGITIDPGSPTTPVDSTSYGFYQNTNGLMNYFGGQGLSTTNPGTYPYTVLSTDYTIAVDTTAARTINLPASPNLGEIHVIKDLTGSAAANNITIQGNGHNIDGAASKIISSNYESVTVQYNDTSTLWMTI